MKAGYCTHNECTNTHTRNSYNPKYLGGPWPLRSPYSYSILVQHLCRGIDANPKLTYYWVATRNQLAGLQLSSGLKYHGDQACSSPGSSCCVLLHSLAAPPSQSSERCCTAHTQLIQRPGAAATKGTQQPAAPAPCQLGG